MKTILVDDEPLMLKSFMRLCDGLTDLEVIGQFQRPELALEFVKENRVELAILDIAMPGMSGIELATKIREENPDILIVFITAFEDHIREANQIGADDYIIKPYTHAIIKRMVDRMKLLVKRQEKNLYIRMFGNFTVMQNDIPIPLSGKAKEILALLVSRCGKEITNEEIFSILWEDREYSKQSMKVYYNAFKRLKDVLDEQNLSNLLISTKRGKMINTEMFDCDYYKWLERMGQNQSISHQEAFLGEFLSEYSWGEYILGDMLESLNYRS